MKYCLIVPVVIFGVAWTAEVVKSFPAPDGDIIGLAWQDESLWAIDKVSGYAYEIDPESGNILNSFLPEDSVGGYTPYGLACGNDTLFVNFGKDVSGGVFEMFDTETGAYLGPVPMC
ncbi:MAG: hypothetical protein H8D05_00355 [FCB group bacterium]|nr:hypothetical protein [FCB group bacterium]